MLQHVLADVWVVKESELGNSESQVHCRTHLGHLLAPGDVVLGSEFHWNATVYFCVNVSYLNETCAN